MLRWHTVHACKPFNEVECQATDKNNGTLYDLSALSDPRGNYVVRLNATAAAVLNVCRSVVNVKAGNAQACPYQSAACLTSSSSADSAPVDIGSVKDGPRYCQFT